MVGEKEGLQTPRLCICQRQSLALWGNYPCEESPMKTETGKVPQLSVQKQL